MNTKGAVVTIALLLVASAWAVGYWPQHRRATALEAELAAVRARADLAEARVRTGGLLGEIRNLEDAVLRQNYGDAQQIALAFFQHARVEAGQAADPRVKQALTDLANRRDAVTGALARADASVLATLREIEGGLRGALGYSVYGANPAVPSPGGQP